MNECKNHQLEAQRNRLFMGKLAASKQNYKQISMEKNFYLKTNLLLSVGREHAKVHQTFRQSSSLEGWRRLFKGHKKSMISMGKWIVSDQEINDELRIDRGPRRANNIVRVTHGCLVDCWRIEKSKCVFKLATIYGFFYATSYNKSSKSWKLWNKIANASPHDLCSIFK